MLVGRLVLTRKTGQMITIHDPKTDTTYEVHVAEIRGDQVRIGIVAPRDVAVMRNELVDRSEIAARKSADSNLTISNSII